LLSKVSWRLLPFILFAYTLTQLDRINLSNVHKTMMADINMTETEYGIAGSIFFIPYVAFELPAMMLMRKWNRHRHTWLMIILGLSGIICGAMVFVNGFGTVLIGRVVLGIVEAGFFPGMYTDTLAIMQSPLKLHCCAVLYDC
jgi:ACS family tartrate transporter-like MFS transporter